MSKSGSSQSMRRRAFEGSCCVHRRDPPCILVCDHDLKSRLDLVKVKHEQTNEDLYKIERSKEALPHDSDFDLWTNPKCESVGKISIESDCILIPFSSKITLFHCFWDQELVMDATSKMKILYGIAAAMKYIYSQDAKYDSLVDCHPTSIFLTENFEPKVLPGWAKMLLEFGLSGEDLSCRTMASTRADSEYSIFYGREFILDNYEASEMNCIFTYSMILLRIYSDKSLVQLMRGHDRMSHYYILRAIASGILPDIPDHVNDNIHQLIESCWCNEKSERPQFKDITELLRTEKELWLDGTNENEFMEYINRVDTPIKCANNNNEEIELMLQQARLRFTMNTNTETSENISDYVIDRTDISVLSSIGSGSFGSVNLCNLKSHPCYDIFAVKSIDFRNRSSSAISDYFMSETEILAKVHHPCTLSLRGVVLPCEESPGQIVTEFLRKGSLADALEKVRSNSPPDFWTPTNIALIATGIAMGMRFVHKKRIWHRDLKPANILLDENYLVRIADFGCSRFADNEATLTQDVGSPYYMAPEISDSGEYDHRVDVYAFGLILFEILTGERVFPTNLTRFAIIKRACEGTRPEIPKNIHPEIQQMIKDCWAVAPQTRPSFNRIVEILASVNFRIIPGVSGLFVQQYYLALEEWEKKYTQ